MRGGSPSPSPLPSATGNSSRNSSPRQHLSASAAADHSDASANAATTTSLESFRTARGATNSGLPSARGPKSGAASSSASSTRNSRPLRERLRHQKQHRHDDEDGDDQNSSSHESASNRRPWVPPLELMTEFNPRNFALILLQRLGNQGVAHLEGSVRGCGVRGITGDGFVEAALRCLAHSVFQPDACSHPWQRRCVVLGAAARGGGASGEPSNRRYESDPLTAAMGFLPSTITAHAGMNFVDAGDRYRFFTEGGQYIDRRTKFLRSVDEAYRAKHMPLQSTIECFDGGFSGGGSGGSSSGSNGSGEALRYALIQLYHAMDVHNANSLSWEELSTYLSDVTTRGASRFGAFRAETYVTTLNREVSFPRSLRVASQALSSGGGANSAAVVTTTTSATTAVLGSVSASDGSSPSSSTGGTPMVLSIANSSPPSITAASFCSAVNRFAITTSGGAVVVLDGSSFALREILVSNDVGSAYGAVSAMDYFTRVASRRGAAASTGNEENDDDGNGSTTLRGIVAVGTADCAVRLYDSTTRQLLGQQRYGSAQTVVKYVGSMRSVVCGARSGLVSLLVGRSHDRWQHAPFSSSSRCRISDVCPLQRTSQLLVADCEGKIDTFDIDTARLVSTFQTPVPCDISTVDYSPYFDVIAFAGPRHSPYLMVPGSGFTPIPVHESESAHHQPLRRVIFLSGTPQLLSCDVGGIVKVWDLRNLQCVQTFQTCRRVPLQQFHFPDDEVSRHSKSLTELMTAHETSSDSHRNASSHGLVYLTANSQRIAALDGCGAEVLQPLDLLIKAERSHRGDEEAADDEDGPAQASAQPGVTASPASQLTSPTEAKDSPSPPRRQQQQPDSPIASLELVTLPLWFVGVAVSSSSSNAGAAAGAAHRPLARQNSFSAALSKLRDNAAGSEGADAEQQRRQIDWINRTAETLIVGHSEHTCYLWRASTGEVVLCLPLRDAYEAWKRKNDAVISEARAARRRQIEREQLQCNSRSGGGSGGATGSGSAAAAGSKDDPLSRFSAAAIRQELDVAARSVAHPRFFTLDGSGQLTIRGVCFSYDEDDKTGGGNGVKEEVEPRDDSSLCLNCGFDVGLEDGMCVRVPLRLTLRPAAPRASHVLDSAKSMRGVCVLTGSYDFNTAPPFPLLRCANFHTASMMEDIRIGADAPAPAVTAIRGLRLVTTAHRPVWWSRGAAAAAGGEGSTLNSNDIDNDEDNVCDPAPTPAAGTTTATAAQSTTSTSARGVFRRGGLAAASGAAFKRNREARRGSWLLEGVVRKVDHVVRVAVGPTAVLYVGSSSFLAPPVVSTWGMVEHPKGVTVSIQLTAGEPGRPFSVSVWCLRDAPAAPVVSPTSSAAASLLLVDREAAAATATAPTQGEDIVVYCGMTNNVSIFYTVRLIQTAEPESTSGSLRTAISSNSPTKSLSGNGQPHRPHGRARSQSLVQTLSSNMASSSESHCNGISFVVQRVVRLRTMPDNGIVHYCNPITTTSLVVAADTVGGVQLLYAPLSPVHYPVCLSRFTSFQPADEPYAPLVVSAQCSEHGLIFLAAGSYVSVFSAQNLFKTCFPDDWATRWPVPQEIVGDANAPPIFLSTGEQENGGGGGSGEGSAASSSNSASRTSQIIRQLEEQIKTQPPTPSLVRFFDLSDACKRIVSMVYVPTKRCLMVGGADGQIHVFSLWGSRISANRLPRHCGGSGEEGAWESVLASDCAGGAASYDHGSVRSGNTKSHDLESAERLPDAAVGRKSHGRTLSALVVNNATGLSIVFNAAGGTLGEMQPCDDDVPFPWGRGKPLSIFRAAAARDGTCGGTASPAGSSPLGSLRQRGGVSFTGTRMKHAGGGVALGRANRASFFRASHSTSVQAAGRDVKEVPPMLSIDRSIIADSGSEEEDDDSSSNSSSGNITARMGGKEGSVAALRRALSFASAASGGGGAGVSSLLANRSASAVWSEASYSDAADGAERVKGMPAAVHRILNLWRRASRGSLLSADDGQTRGNSRVHRKLPTTTTSASLVQPSESQRRRLAEDANQNSGKEADAEAVVGRTVEALLNQDILEAYRHLEGEAKETSIMMALMERQREQKLARKAAAQLRKLLVARHDALMATLRRECALAFEESDYSTQLSASSIVGGGDGSGVAADSTAAPEEPSLRQHINLNCTQTFVTYRANGTERRRPGSGNSASQQQTSLMRAILPTTASVDANSASATNTSTVAGGNSTQSDPSGTKDRPANATSSSSSQQQVGLLDGGLSHERELISFASAAGSLIKRFRSNRSKSLQAALVRLVGSERQLAGDLSVEEELEQQIQRDAEHEIQATATATNSSSGGGGGNGSSMRRRSTMTAMSVVSTDDGQGPQQHQQQPHDVDGSSSHQEALQGYRFGEPGAAMNSVDDAEIIRDNNEDEDSAAFDRDVIRVTAASSFVGRRRASSSAARPDSAASSSSRPPSAVGAKGRRESVPSSASTSGSPRRRFSSISVEPVTVEISRVEATITKRRSVSMASAMHSSVSSGGGGGNGSASADGNESHSSSLLRWSNLVADRRGMRQQKRAQAAVKMVTVAHGSAVPAQRAGDVLSAEGATTQIDASPLPQQLEEAGVISTPDPSPQQVEAGNEEGDAHSDEEEQQRHRSGWVGLELTEYAVSTTPSLRLQTASLLVMKALEGIADASEAPRHVTPYVSRRLHHRCRRSPLQVFRAVEPISDAAGGDGEGDDGDAAVGSRSPVTKDAVAPSGRLSTPLGRRTLNIGATPATRPSSAASALVSSHRRSLGELNGTAGSSNSSIGLPSRPLSSAASSSAVDARQLLLSGAPRLQQRLQRHAQQKQQRVARSQSFGTR